MVAWRSFLVGGLLWPALTLAESSDALVWLERMEQAQRQQSYQGTFIHEQRNGLLHSLRLQHRVDDAGVRDHLEYLDGPERALIRQGQQLYYRAPDQAGSQSLAPDLGRLGQSWAMPERLQSYYRFDLGGDDRVAGRAAVVVDVVPKDRNRYGMRLWLDRETGLLLKNLVIDAESGVLERMQFTEFSTELDAVAARHQQPQPASNAEDTVAEAGEPLPWQASWVPEGFELTRQGQQPSRVTDQPVSALSFSDGLAHFSIFVEANQDPVLNDARQRQGATSVLSKVMFHQGQYFLVTVVGEIPLGTAERIAVSVQANTLARAEP